MKQKTIIYQILPRLFSNSNLNPIFNGTIEENGCGKFNHLTINVLSELKDFGITHIWLTGIIRHATLTDYSEHGLPRSHSDIVKGNAGSPYAISDYFDVDPDLAEEIPLRMKEFEQLVKRIHSLGMKVIIDFVPNHVARDYWSKQLPEGIKNLGEGDNKNVPFSSSNNYYYLPGHTLKIEGLVESCPIRFFENPAKATGNDVFRPNPGINDWYETVKLNYGHDYRDGQNHFKPIPDTWIRMVEILFFWSGKGVDGFRCDMAGMVPVNFWRYAISLVKSNYERIIFIAELYEPSKYREYLENGFFDYLYDKVGMYDSLRLLVEGKGSSHSITGVWQKLEGMDDKMVRFLENHDEQRIASQYFAHDPWKAIPAIVVCTLLNQGPLLLYSGQEVGEPAEGRIGFSGDDGRTSIFDYSVMPEFQKWFNNGFCDGKYLSDNQREIRLAYAKLLRFANKFSVFSNGSMYDLMWANSDLPFGEKLFAFLRFVGTEHDDVVLVVVSFAPSINEINVKIPQHALQAIGFDGRNRITIRQIEPFPANQDNLLSSQIITVGIKVHLNPERYAIVALI
jgi:glycosidase